MALLTNAKAQVKVRALYAAIRQVFDEERGRMNDAGCDLCGSHEGVDFAHAFMHEAEPPYLCLRHRCSWGISQAHNKSNLSTELKFAQWLAAMVHKEAKKSSQSTGVSENEVKST